MSLKLHESLLEYRDTTGISKNLQELIDFEIAPEPLLPIQDMVTPDILSRLVCLNLSHCNLERVPSFLRACSSLQELNLSSNRLTRIPASFFTSSMPFLKILDLSDNYLSNMSDIVGLNVLQDLEILSLHGNPLPGITNRVELLRLLLFTTNNAAFNECLLSRQRSKYNAFLNVGSFHTIKGAYSDAVAQAVRARDFLLISNYDYSRLTPSSYALLDLSVEPDKLTNGSLFKYSEVSAQEFVVYGPGFIMFKDPRLNAPFVLVGQREGIANAHTNVFGVSQRYWSLLKSSDNYDPLADVGVKSIAPDAHYCFFGPEGFRYDAPLDKQRRGDKNVRQIPTTDFVRQKFLPDNRIVCTASSGRLEALQLSPAKMLPNVIEARLQKVTQANSFLINLSEREISTKSTCFPCLRVLDGRIVTIDDYDRALVLQRSHLRTSELLHMGLSTRSNFLHSAGQRASKQSPARASRRMVSSRKQANLEALATMDPTRPPSDAIRIRQEKTRAESARKSEAEQMRKKMRRFISTGELPDDADQDLDSVFDSYDNDKIESMLNVNYYDGDAESVESKLLCAKARSSMARSSKGDQSRKADEPISGVGGLPRFPPKPDYTGKNANVTFEEVSSTVAPVVSATRNEDAAHSSSSNDMTSSQRVWFDTVRLNLSNADSVPVESMIVAGQHAGQGGADQQKDYSNTRSEEQPSGTNDDAAPHQQHKGATPFNRQNSLQQQLMSSKSALTLSEVSTAQPNTTGNHLPGKPSSISIKKPPTSGAAAAVNAAKPLRARAASIAAQPRGTLSGRSTLTVSDLRNDPTDAELLHRLIDTTASKSVSHRGFALSNIAGLSSARRPSPSHLSDAGATGSMGATKQLEVIVLDSILAQDSTKAEQQEKLAQRRAQQLKGKGSDSKAGIIRGHGLRSSLAITDDEALLEYTTSPAKTADTLSTVLLNAGTLDEYEVVKKADDLFMKSSLCPVTDPTAARAAPSAAQVTENMLIDFRITKLGKGPLLLSSDSVTYETISNPVIRPEFLADINGRRIEEMVKPTFSQIIEDELLVQRQRNNKMLMQVSARVDRKVREDLLRPTSHVELERIPGHKDTNVIAKDMGQRAQSASTLKRHSVLLDAIMDGSKLRGIAPEVSKNASLLGRVDPLVHNRAKAMLEQELSATHACTRKTIGIIGPRRSESARYDSLLRYTPQEVTEDVDRKLYRSQLRMEASMNKKPRMGHINDEDKARLMANLLRTNNEALAKQARQEEFSEHRRRLRDIKRNCTGSYLDTAMNPTLAVYVTEARRAEKLKRSNLKAQRSTSAYYMNTSARGHERLKGKDLSDSSLANGVMCDGHLVQPLNITTIEEAAIEASNVRIPPMDLIEMGTDVVLNAQKNTGELAKLSEEFIRGELAWDEMTQDQIYRLTRIGDKNRKSALPIPKLHTVDRKEGLVGISLGLKDTLEGRDLDLMLRGMKQSSEAGKRLSDVIAQQKASPKRVSRKSVADEARQLAKEFEARVSQKIDSVYV